MLPLFKYFKTFCRQSLIICICIFFDAPATAQPNLIPNPGFENFTTCPVGFSQFNGFVSNWNNPSTASPDYMNACANPFPAGAPANGTGYQLPHAGNGYTGAYLTGGLYKEYIQIQLASPLAAGQLYNFKMYVVLHNKSNIATDDIGAYFSVTAPVSAGTGYLNGNPVAQVNNPAGNVITDSLNWTLISGNYIATGGEQFITIGHFKPDATTTYTTVGYGGQGTYYYFDDISLTTGIPLPLEMISFTAGCDHNKNNVQLDWITGSEVNLCCFDVEKSTDGNTFLFAGKVDASGNSSHHSCYSFTDHSPEDAVIYYRLKETDQDGHFTYSHTVAIDYQECSKNFAEPLAYFYGDQLYIYFNENMPAAEVTVFDMNGKKIFYKNQLSGRKAESILTPEISAGIYLIRLQSQQGFFQSVTRVLHP